MLGESVRRRQPGGGRPPREPGTEPKGGGARRWRPLLIALPVALVVPFLIGYVIAVYVIFPPTEVSGAGIPVPDLVGSTAEGAQRTLAGAGLGPIATTELPHPSAPAGQVVAQTPLPGQQLRPGASVTVALSTGRARAVVPDVTGFSSERAESMLRRTGFEVAIVTQESPAAAGRVLRTDPEPAQQVTLPAVITLVVSSGPAAPPDTIFGEVPLREPAGPPGDAGAPASR